ncbi:MAG TPA: ribose-5-phosphate isomerase RpiA [Steroidobacteraceae bacterium]|jgi:ribose 5-phosphate isomerase A|nr:ribose-5-phosphate isomerase RpiA [Steroidobacteraceae bacterium]
MAPSADEKKKQAAHAALKYVRAGMILGVGTGSTVNFFIDALAASTVRVSGAVSSSNASTARLERAGIRVMDLNEVGSLEVYVDGADEATRERHLIKGGGAALTGEKIVAAASKQFVCVVDDSKLVTTLGRFPLPVEVIPMARRYVSDALTNLGGRPVWRQNVVTDNGNHILDVHGLTIRDPVAMECTINQIVGVVTVGLFAARGADVLIVAGDKGVDIL